ncbi:hypothetical protein ACFWNK_33685 [Streptomyces sp. NPDC058417]|uniref:hypothetical protein n=1 Tax=unclassified Streptomyces TaxID=2593676 RepID=UPI00366525C3
MHWTATTPSSLIKSFQLLVDGKTVATVSGTAASANVTLALGNHTVAAGRAPVRQDPNHRQAERRRGDDRADHHHRPEALSAAV